MILIRCVSLVMFLSCVLSKEYVYDYGLDNVVTEIEQRYSFWPSVHNALRLRKRELKPSATMVSEGGAEVADSQSAASPKSAAPTPAVAKDQPLEPTVPKDKVELPKPPVAVSNETITASVVATNETATNATILVPAPKQIDLQNSKVVMRGIIVFGGFLLLASFYYLFYKTKGNKNEAGNTNSNDNNQFRYGVLHSEDRRDNLELSRIPLTMESDDDEDEDLEIFDLGQKKQSLSYVNLHTNDEDVVFQNPAQQTSDDKDNLLLDIEDSTSDPLINWNQNGNKSIL